jgi:NAD(P)H dehydrogenase (quinone)
VNVLIVFAHPEPRSFNGALRDVAVATLRADGHEVEVSDLYAAGFKAVADADDFALRADSTYLCIDLEQAAAQEAGTISPDIRAEQGKVARADLVVLQFPLWWFGPPAILKGWFDRVFTRGFGYRSGCKYDTGLMRGKRAMLSVTTGTSADTYAADGIDGGILDILWPIHNGLLRYTGFEVHAPNLVHMPHRMSDTERAAELQHYASLLHQIDDQPTLFFHPSSDYGTDERLLAHVTPASGFQHRAKQPSPIDQDGPS